MGRKKKPVKELIPDDEIDLKAKRRKTFNEIMEDRKLKAIQFKQDQADKQKARLDKLHAQKLGKIKNQQIVNK